jgi:cytochrome c oxidase assembly protein subunit 15
MVAATVGMLMVTLMVLLYRWETRSWVRWLARAAVLAVVLQGLLGGLTVLLRLPTLVSVTHACLAQAFFCLTVILSVCTAPGWYIQRRQREETTSPSLRLITTGTTVMIYVQLILGALMRHTGAGLAIPDFPLAFGRLIPPFESPAVIIHFLHRLGAVAVTVGIAWTVVRVLSQYSDEPYLRRPVVGLTGLLIIQLTLGAVTIWTQRSVVPMTAHVAVGAAVLATSLLLTLRVYRLINSAVSVHGRDFFSEQVTT